MTPALIGLAGLGIGWLCGLLYEGTRRNGTLHLHLRLAEIERERDEYARRLLDVSVARHPAGKQRPTLRGIGGGEA